MSSRSPASALSLRIDHQLYRRPICAPCSAASALRSRCRALRRAAEAGGAETQRGKDLMAFAIVRVAYFVAQAGDGAGKRRVRASHAVQDGEVGAIQAEYLPPLRSAAPRMRCARPTITRSPKAWPKPPMMREKRSMVPSTTTCGTCGSGQARLEAAAVGQAGQRIVAGLVAQLILQPHLARTWTIRNTQVSGPARRTRAPAP
jgi:hypothetical protein